MKINPFELERYFAKYEFAARYLLSCSDCEAVTMAELLELADPETRQLWEKLALGYTDSWGHPLLRQAISEIYQNIDAAQVLLAVPEEGIFLLMNALLAPGDHIICMVPGYQSLYEVAQSIGCEVSAWQPIEEQGWHFDVTQLETLLKPNTRLIVINFPHNPTGYVPSRDDFEELIKFARQHNLYIFSDEMYRFLEIDPNTILPAACELYDQAFSLFGLSKSFGLPGLRIGWIVSKNQAILGRISRLKDYTTICASAPSEILAIIAVRQRQHIIAKQLTRIRRNLTVLDKFFAEYTDCINWQRPRGGSICFPRLLIPQNADEFCKDLVHDAQIMLVPSNLFKFGSQHVRIGFGRENLPTVLARFADYLSQRFR